MIIFPPGDHYHAALAAIMVASYGLPAQDAFAGGEQHHGDNHHHHRG